LDNKDEWSTWWWGNKKTKEQGPFIAMNMPRWNLWLIAQDIKDYHLVALSELLAIEIRKPKKKTIWNSKEMGLVCLTRQNQSPSSACGLIDDWTATKTKRSVG
jgi:hypothetical protein